MDNEQRKIDSTDLIDVGNIPNYLEEDATVEQGEVSDISKLAAHANYVENAPVIADIKERFAAMFMDCAFLFLIYWMILLPYRAIAFGQAEGPIPVSGINGLIFHGIFLLIALLWFTVQEFAFSATVGKALCHICVRKSDGSPPTFAAAIIRNLIRPIDILLSPLLIPIAAMEWTAWHKRLGDMAAGTLVIRKLGRVKRQYALSLDIVASTSRRAIAFLMDLILFATFSFGFSLMLTPEHPIMSMLMVMMFPFALLALMVLPEWLTNTSPGKWVMGLAICHEDGSGIGLSTALIRNLWRSFDCNPLGFFTSLFSIRKQRPGDTAAGSIVVRVPREWIGLAGLAGVIIVAAAVTYAGANNRENYLMGNFQVNFLPSLDVKGTGQSMEAIMQRNLGIRNFKFAAGDAQTERKPAIYQPGETVYMSFDVGGFEVTDGKAWIQEDLSILYPDGSVGLKLENINDFKQELTQKGPVRFENNIALPEKADPGRYTVTINLRDKLGKRELKEQRFFYITPGESVTVGQGAGAAPAPTPGPATPPATPSIPGQPSTETAPPAPAGERETPPPPAVQPPRPDAPPTTPPPSPPGQGFDISAPKGSMEPPAGQGTQQGG